MKLTFKCPDCGQTKQLEQFSDAELTAMATQGEEWLALRRQRHHLCPDGQLWHLRDGRLERCAVYIAEADWHAVFEEPELLPVIEE